MSRSAVLSCNSNSAHHAAAGAQLFARQHAPASVHCLLLAALRTGDANTAGYSAMRALRYATATCPSNQLLLNASWKLHMPNRHVHDACHTPTQQQQLARSSSWQCQDSHSSLVTSKSCVCTGHTLRAWSEADCLQASKQLGLLQLDPLLR
jgi:hypothetical protein